MNGVGCAVGCLWEGLKEAEAVCSDGRAFVWREKGVQCEWRVGGCVVASWWVCMVSPTSAGV
eukprot:913791-Amorphochlora_amoeboformis.AAC.2